MDKLCGGTLFILLVHSSKNSANEQSLLSDVLKVFKSNLFIDNSTLKEQTKKFKLCKEHSSLATPFEDSSTQKELIDEIKNNYAKLLKSTSELIDNYIDPDPKICKGELLIKAVLEVIKNDSSISDQQEFYVLPNGKTVKKCKLLSMTKFFLPSFLLGILFYVIINIKDNKEGAETYDVWCPKPKSGTKRKYTANIGENSNKQVFILNSPDEYSYNELLDLSDEAVTRYVIRIPDKTDYDIAASPIMISDNIDRSNSEAYNELLLNSHDYKKLNSFIADFNQLISYITKYQNSRDQEEINVLGNTKRKFFNTWIDSYYNFKFDNASVQKWFECVLDKIEKSKIIDINNVTIIPKHIEIDPEKVWGKSFASRHQKINYFCIKKEDDDKADNSTK